MVVRVLRWGVIVLLTTATALWVSEGAYGAPVTQRYKNALCSEFHHFPDEVNELRANWGVALLGAPEWRPMYMSPLAVTNMTTAWQRDEDVQPGEWVPYQPYGNILAWKWNSTTAAPDRYPVRRTWELTFNAIAVARNDDNVTRNHNFGIRLISKSGAPFDITTNWDAVPVQYPDHNWYTTIGIFSHQFTIKHTWVFTVPASTDWTIAIVHKELALPQHTSGTFTDFHWPKVRLRELTTHRDAARGDAGGFSCREDIDVYGYDR